LLLLRQYIVVTCKIRDGSLCIIVTYNTVSYVFLSLKLQDGSVSFVVTCDIVVAFVTTLNGFLCLLINYDVDLFVLQVTVVTSAESNTELLPKPDLLCHARPLVELHTDFGVELALLSWPLH